nr:MAG TPA: hypothetical protein [Caudoviricetes sp.]
MQKEKIYLSLLPFFSIPHWKCGSSSVGRASASQAEGRGFESRLPLKTKEIDNQTNDAIINLFFICPVVKNKTKTHLILSLFVLLCIFVYRKHVCFHHPSTTHK